MLLLRLLAILAVIAISTCVAIYFFTGDRKYLSYGLRLLKVSLGIVLLFFAFLILERLVVLV